MRTKGINTCNSVKISVHLSEEPDPTSAHLRIKDIKFNVEILMNFMNTVDLTVEDSQNVDSSVRDLLVKDKGEIIIIEGKHVAVDKNNNRIDKNVEYSTPLWLIGEYA